VPPASPQPVPPARLSLGAKLAASSFTRKRGTRLTLTTDGAAPPDDGDEEELDRVLGGLAPEASRRRSLPVTRVPLFDDLDQATEVCLSLITDYSTKVEGIKISLLDDAREIALRRRLPDGIRMYTGDDFNYDHLIGGDEQGYSDALPSTSSGNFTAYLVWIGSHSVQFVVYRALLMIAFAVLLSLPFTLFRIIVAQEILGREENDDEESDSEEIEGTEEKSESEDEDKEEQEPDGMPAFAWRGKGFAVMAAWTGLFGLIFFAAGTLASTIYLLTSAASLSPHTTGDAAPMTGLFTVLTFTVGGGLLAFSCLFFGAVIARSGRNLWPGSWLFFSYMALAIAALMSGSAVQVAFAPATGQAALSTPAILLFALWALWFGVMVVRLKPE